MSGNQTATWGRSGGEPSSSRPRCSWGSFLGTWSGISAHLFPDHLPQDLERLSSWWVQVGTSTWSQSQCPVPACCVPQNLGLPGDQLLHWLHDCCGEKASSHQKPPLVSLLALDTEQQDGTMAASSLVTPSLAKRITLLNKDAFRKISWEVPFSRYTYPLRFKISPGNPSGRNIYILIFWNSPVFQLKQWIASGLWLSSIAIFHAVFLKSVSSLDKGNELH